ncbi:hypothetical protein OESDEN_18758, partial [Oesophagostomum dentatum]
FQGFWVTVPQISTSFIYSTVYEKFRSVLNQDLGLNSVAGISSLAGGAASFASQSIFVPTDIIAQYMMVYYKADKFVSGSNKAVIDYVRNEKNPRLTLGLRFVRAIYKMRKRTTDSPGILLIDQAVAATFGGAASSICTNPMEMFRVRLQIHRTNYKET